MYCPELRPGAPSRAPLILSEQPTSDFAFFTEVLSERPALIFSLAKIGYHSRRQLKFSWEPSTGAAQSVPSYLRRDPHAGQGDTRPGGQENKAGE